MEIIRKNLGIYGANTYIIFDESKKAIVIDCGGDHDDVVKILNEKDLVLEAIVLTHGHFDHIGGVNKLREATGAKVYGAQYERDLFDNADHNLSTSTLLGPITVKCDHYFDDGDTLDFTPIKLQVMHTPGHTEGGSVFFGNNHLFTGDTLFNMSCGRTDLYSGNQQKLEDSLRKIAVSFPDSAIVCPGHGPTSTLKFEKENNPYLTRLL